MNFKFPLLLLILISLVYISCKKDDIQAQNSMVGDWNVVEINSFYGEFTATGSRPIETIVEQGQLGTFNFDQDSVTFTFTRNDTLFTGNSAWNLLTEEQRSGFFTELVFTLTIENEFIFDVGFEDRTRDSERNAQELTFMNNPNNGPGVQITMILEKI